MCLEKGRVKDMRVGMWKESVILLVMSVKREVEGVVAEVSGIYPPDYKFAVLNEHYTHTRDTSLSSSRAHSFQAEVIVL